MSINCAQTNIPVYLSAYDKEPILTSLEGIVDMMRNDAGLKAKTEEHRRYRAASRDTSISTSQQLEAKSKADELKRKLPTMSPGGICRDGRKREHVVALTPYMCIDIDHIPQEKVQEVRTALQSLPYVVAANLTCSTEGLHAIVSLGCGEWMNQRWQQGDRSVFKYVFNKMRQKVEAVIGYSLDSKCDTPEHMFIMSSDENAYFNPDAVPMEIDVTDYESPGNQKKTRRRKTKTSTESVSLEECCGSILMELEHKGSYYEDGNRNKYVFDFASAANAYGVDKAEVDKYAEQAFSDMADSERTATINSAYGYEESHGKRKLKSGGTSGKKYCTPDELREGINAYGQFRRNMLKGEYEILLPDADEWRTMEDEDENNICTSLRDTGKYTTTSDVRMVIHSDFTPKYDPIAEFFKGLPHGEIVGDCQIQFDGDAFPSDPIGDLARRIKLTNNDIDHVKYFRKWLVSMVKGWMDPEHPNDCILILIGEQGIYKTTFLRYLLPPELRKEYFSVKTNSSRLDKDEKMKMARQLLIVHEEVDAMKNADSNQLKAILSMTKIDERAAYARNMSHLERVCSLAGTGNQIQIITDKTGSRRYLILSVESILSPFDNPIDYQALYAHALALALADKEFKSYITKDDIAELTEYNKRYEVDAPEDALIDKYFGKPTPGNSGVMMGAHEIISYIKNQVGNNINLDARAVNAYLRKNGFKEKRRSYGVVFQVVKREQIQITARELEGVEPVPDPDADEGYTTYKQAYGSETGGDNSLFADEDVL